MRILKLCAITLLVLVVLSFIVHFNELLNYVGNAIIALLPIIITIVANRYTYRTIFR